MHYTIDSLSEGHLGHCKVLAVRNKAVHVCVQVFGWTRVSAHLGEYHGAQLLDRMVRVRLVL